MSFLFKFIRTKTITISLLFFFILFQFYFFNNYKSHLESIKLNIESETKFDTLPGNKVYLNDKEYIASPYESLLSKYGEELSSLDYHDKCVLYFKELYQNKPQWTITDFKELSYQRNIFENRDHFVKIKIDNFKQKNLKNIKTEYQKDLIVKEKNLNHIFELEWQEVVKTTRIAEQMMADSSTHLRVYGACFLDSYGQQKTLNIAQKKKKKNQSINIKCHDIEVRLFQWLSRKLPIYKRWNGEVLKTMPVISNYITQDAESSKHEKSSCYLQNLRNGFNGKGITVSASEKHLNQLIQLLGILRATGNKLPIQIFHSGDLSKHAQKILIKMARNVKNLNLSIIDNLDHMLKERGITLLNKKEYPEEYLQQIELLFPKQELWFVDITGSISNNYLKKFSGFASKLLAYFFNSFQHSILMDVDAVPVVNLEEYIFGSKFYKEKGAYFFKDRELFFRNSKSDMVFYKKLMPSIVDSALFGIPEITEVTLENRFIGSRYFHLMESGIVTTDKKRHFLGILATLQLALWYPVTSKIWGDKELFWLGMSSAGDEDYYLNYWPAGSIGNITPRERRLIDDKTDERRSKLVGNELCSTHPAHMSPEDNSTILWWNSGFQYCKFPDASKNDIKNPFTKGLFETADELKEMYSTYQKMESLIIPQSSEHYVANDKGENTRSWKYLKVCEGYIWCAYDAVGGDTSDKYKGLLKNIDNQTKLKFNYYGSIYQNAEKIVGVRRENDSE